MSYPYPRPERPAGLLYAYSAEGRSIQELLLLDSLAGLLAREQPCLFRLQSVLGRDTNDPAARWLFAMCCRGATVDDSVCAAPTAEVVAKVLPGARDRFPSLRFVRCEAEGPSVSTAVTLAAASDGVIVAAGEMVARLLSNLGLPLLCDVRSVKPLEVLRELSGRLRERIVVFQDHGKMHHLADYAVFARAPYLQFGAEPDADLFTLGRMSGVGAAFGWSCEHQLVRTCSARGVLVHAADWCVNLPVLAGAPAAEPSVQPCFQTTAVEAGPAPAHTVALVMTDGDNLQWALGQWAVESRWFGSPNRGSVCMGWTLSPALAHVAPVALEEITSLLTSSDELVAGPSGVGYVFPGSWPRASLEEYAQLTGEAMRACGMRVLNVLAGDDAMPSKQLLTPFAALDVVDAILYYPFGGHYARFGAKVWWVCGKPVITARVSLWGDAMQGTGVGVEALTTRLKALAKDPTRSDAYSLIPVHCWSHGFSSIERLLRGLEGCNIDFVTPSELVRRVFAGVPRGECPEEMLGSPQCALACNASNPVLQGLRGCWKILYGAAQDWGVSVGLLRGPVGNPTNHRGSTSCESNVSSAPSPELMRLREMLRAFGRYPANDLGDDHNTHWENVRNTAIVEVRVKLRRDLRGASNADLWEAMSAESTKWGIAADAVRLLG